MLEIKEFLHQQPLQPLHQSPDQTLHPLPPPLPFVTCCQPLAPPTIELYSPVPRPNLPLTTCLSRAPCPPQLPTTLSTPLPYSQHPLSSNAAISPSVTPSRTTPLLQSSIYLTGLAKNVQLQSYSRKNFYASMVCRLFSLEEFKSSNIKRKLGKRLPDRVRLWFVHRSALEAYPLAGGESNDVVWRQSSKAIPKISGCLNGCSKAWISITFLLLNFYLT